MTGRLGVRSNLALTVASVLLAAGFPGCSTTLHSSSTACARARIAGRTVCLRAQQRCERRYERVYRSYALTCKPGADGYRLRERTYVGPPNP